jgi:twitching motility two-component system response regulator PilH
VAESKQRILVVDDSEDIRDFFHLVLEQAGYEVITASSGNEAFEKTRASRPNLILLDLIMPGMDGLEFLTLMRSNIAPPIPPTILCSGFDLTEEQALRQGALMFVRKPVAPADLLDFVAHGLRGQRVGAELAARERANSITARKVARQAADDFVAQVRNEMETRSAGQMEWLASYFGVHTAVIGLEENGHLGVFAEAGDPSFTLGLDLARRLPPCQEVLESGSSLVLADASTHACFSSGPYRLEGVRFFGGVPLLAPSGVAIGVVCIIDPLPRHTHAEDLQILERVGKQGSLLLRMLATQSPSSHLPGRLGAGMMLRPTLEVILEAEVRMLRESGGSMALAVVELEEPERMRELVLSAPDRQRLGAGALGTTRVAVYKRDANDDAAAQIDEILRRLEETTPSLGVGVASIEGSGLPAIGGRDLIRLAEVSLDHALQSGGGTERLVLHHEATQPAT